MNKVIEVGVISKNAKILKRMEAICKEFDYSFGHWPDLETFMDAEPDCMVIITYTSEHQGESKEDAAECCQASKGICTDAFVVCAVGNRVAKESLPFLKASGADLIMLENETFNTSKLEFVFTQTLRARYFPIKMSDLVVGTKADFHIYHLMPLNKKYLPCIPKGVELTQARYDKIQQDIAEVYVKRDDIALFRAYIKANHKDVGSLQRRCRAQFLELCNGYTDLALLLTDQGEAASFDRGKILVDKCRALCSALLSTVASVDNVWEIVDNCSIGNMASVERSPAIATYVALFGMILNMKDDELNNAMIAALLADLGLLYISPNTLYKLRNAVELNSEELEEYEIHPIKSVNLVLERKLQIEAELRNVIEMTHERVDKKGFPRQPNPLKISKASQLIQFCQDLDTKTLVCMGRKNEDKNKVRQQLITEEAINPQKYDETFISRLAAKFGTAS